MDISFSSDYAHNPGMVAYLDQIDFVEILISAWSLDVQYGDNVLMIEVSQELHLTQSTQTEHGVVERRDFLDRDLLSGRLV